MIVSENIKKLREAAGVLQKDFAKLAGINVSTLRRAEQDDSVSASTATKIKTALSELAATGKGAKAPKESLVDRIVVPGEFADLSNSGLQNLLRRELRQGGADYLHHLITHSTPKKCQILLKSQISHPTAKAIQSKLEAAL